MPLNTVGRPSKVPVSSALNQVWAIVPGTAWTWPVSDGTHQPWTTSVEVMLRTTAVSTGTVSSP